MPESLLWWAAVQLVGVAVTPIALALFRWLPDRGYVFSKSLGLLLVAYVYWVGGLTGLLPNEGMSILGIVLALALVSAVVTWRTRAELDTHLRRQWAYMLFVEVLFAVTFAAAAVLRSYVPDIGYGEKPANFAFFNAVLRADSFPPQDPWLSGHTLSYYYFGHVMAASLTRVTGIEPAVAVNLGGVLLAALAVVNVFALVYNLVLGRGTVGRALLFGLVAVVLLAFLTNLEGLFELLAAHGIGSKDFYGMLGISGLDGPRSTDAWYPTEPYWWWRVTRVASNWDHHEMPFVSFLAGDIHPHVNGLPFVLLALGMALSMLRSPAELSHRFWLRSPWWLFVMAAAVGALGFLNPWDLPTFLLVIVAAALLRNCLAQGRLGLKAIVDTAAFAAPLGALAVLMYLPAIDYAFLQFLPGAHPVGQGIQPLETASSGFPPVEATATRPHHFLYIWGPMLAVAAFFAVAAVGRWGRPRALLWMSFLPGLAPVALWALLILGRRGPVGFADELATRGASWITVALLVGLLAVVTLAFLHHLRVPPGEETDRTMLFALGAMGTGVMLILGSEFFWAQDPANVRSNTAFRLGYQAWVLLAVAGAYGLYHVTALSRPSIRWQHALRWAGAAAVAVVLAAGLVYPAMVTFYRTDDFQGHQSLDGLVLVSFFDPDEYDATLWLRDNVQDTPVVLEAIGDSFSPYGRISSRTGLPTVLGWPDHEHRWRGSWEPQEGRREDVELAYETTSVTEAAAVLDKYDVRYVYVGGAERDAYGERGMAKFAKLGEVVYQNPKVTIYRIGGCDAVLC